MVYSLNKEESVYAYDDDIKKLKTEFQILLDNLDEIALVTNKDKETIKNKILNAMEALRIAEKYLDKVGVVLW